MIELADQELVALARVGNLAAFETLVRRHQTLVRNWLRRLGKDASRADDLAQETFVQVWQQLGSYRGDGQFRSWLLKIAYSRFLQHLRKHKSEAALLERVELLDPADDSRGHHDEAPDAGRMLALLNVEERACLLLCYSHGYSHSEISELLSLPLGSVKSLLRRSVLRIREHLRIEA